MNTFYEKIATQLEPFKDKVFFQPLKKVELEILERKIGLQFPDYYKQFLLYFGLRQDFIPELIKQEDDLVTGHSYLPEQYKKTFIPIGDTSGEEMWLLKITDNKDQQLYQWQPLLEDQVAPLGITFSELVQISMDDLKKNYSSKVPNTLKKWCVQFTITTNDELKILKTINAKRKEDWIVKQAYLGGIHCYETEIILATNHIKFYKHEHEGWDAPAYYFDFNEPTYQMGENSLIKRLDNQLKKKFVKYRLIDYGILPII